VVACALLHQWGEGEEDIRIGHPVEGEKSPSADAGNADEGEEDLGRDMSLHIAVAVKGNSHHIDFAGVGVGEDHHHHSCDQERDVLEDRCLEALLAVKEGDTGCCEVVGWGILGDSVAVVVLLVGVEDVAASVAVEAVRVGHSAEASPLGDRLDGAVDPWTVVLRDRDMAQAWVIGVVVQVHSRLTAWVTLIVSLWSPSMWEGEAEPVKTWATAGEMEKFFVVHCAFVVAPRRRGIGTGVAVAVEEARLGRAAVEDDAAFHAWADSIGSGEWGRIGHHYHLFPPRAAHSVCTSLGVGTEAVPDVHRRCQEAVVDVG